MAYIPDAERTPVTQKDIVLTEINKVNVQFCDNSRWSLSCSIPQGIEVGIGAVILNLLFNDIFVSTALTAMSALLIKNVSFVDDGRQLRQKHDELVQRLEDLNKTS